MPAKTTRLAGAISFSLATHIALLCAILTWLARPPAYHLQEDQIPAWVVRLVPPPPRTPEETVRNRAADRRPVRPILSRPASQDDEVSPIVIPRGSGEVAAGTAGAIGSAGDSSDDATGEKVRRALRSGAVGCANAELVGLNRRERDHCADIFGEDMAAILRAMRNGEQNRLSVGGDPPKDYGLFRDACRAVREQSGQGGSC